VPLFPPSMARAKQITKLNCQDAAARAIPQVLQARMKQMCALRVRALDWNDPEGVHDMRVASRRLRSALADFKPYLRKGSIPIRRLKAIAKNLGAVRDEDVVLAALAELRLKVDEKVGKGIEAIAEEHRRQRRRARPALERAIKASAIADLRADFQARLRTAMKIPAQLVAGENSNQVLTFGQVGAKVIGNRLKQINDASDSVYRPLRPKQLHKMRILAKRLRYAVELFAPCWGEEFKKFAEEIARLQTSLGELHDCDVWIVNLGSRIKKGASEAGAGLDPWRNNEAVVWLLQHFVNERTKHYSSSLARWHKWQTEGFLDQLNAMLDADRTSAAEVPQNNSQPKINKGG
jgi:CHAD domain-containing protein